MELTRVDAQLRLDIRYATANNFMRMPLYQQARAFLQRPAALALAAADRDFHRLGYGIIVFDGYRPWHVTWLMWEKASPQWRQGYVADPATGSRHNRGCAVDISLYDLRSGQEVEMPTPYDSFSEAAHSDFGGGTDKSRQNRALLARIMLKHGFTELSTEWWHFDYRLWPQYPILNVDFDQISDNQDADLVLRGGSVYTMDAARSWAEAVAVRDGRIVYVGTTADTTPYIGPQTRVLDLAGKMVLPAFCDSHVHPVSSGVELSQCNLADLQTVAAVLTAIRNFARSHPEKTWVQGTGWALPVFPQANPHKEQLDAVVPDRPAAMESADGHSLWVNSRALALAGITRQTADPAGGRIERDGSGQPSGTLREAAVHLVERRIPPPTAAEYMQGLRRGLGMANRFGIASVQEAAADEAILAAYAEADGTDTLTARVHAAVVMRPEKGLEQVGDLLEKRRRYEGRRLRVDGAKIFADGVLEAHTAALLQPYLHSHFGRGTLNFPPPLFNGLVTALDAAGVQVHVHAIGDRAIRAALDAFAAALRANGWHDLRHHIAHLQLIHPSDIPRFSRLHVVANFQPLWAQADLYVTRLTDPFLGPERARWQYPLASVTETGAVMVGGSDWNVSSMNPLDAIQVAMTRRPLDKPKSASWLPAQRMQLADLLAMYTIRGAYLAHEEQITGSIEVGKSADLIVLDRNLFSIPAEQIHRARVLMTWLEGKAVFTAPTAR